MKMDEIRKKESILDGPCTFETITGMSEPTLNNLRLLGCTGVKGITRIVIEWNADTGTGYRRVVTEDRETVTIRRYREEHPGDDPYNPGNMQANERMAKLEKRVAELEARPDYTSIIKTLKENEQEFMEQVGSFFQNKCGRTPEGRS